MIRMRNLERGLDGGLETACVAAAWLCMTRRPALQQVETDENDQRDDQENRGDRGSTHGVVVLDLVEDVNRRHLRFERKVAGDQNGRTELADSAGKRERGAG